MIWTFGYEGRSLIDVTELVGDEAHLLDIRFSARSPNPDFRGTTLREVFGTRYCHVPELGNRRYKLGPPVEIVDFPAGQGIVREESARGDVYLMCACRDKSGCHRSEVAQRLREAGLEVAEARWRKSGDAKETR